jgi:hypothetical protein
MTNLTAIRHDGWTYDRQRKFLETLAETGSAVIAAEECKISPRSAYNLRNRRDGAAFQLGWDAAILVARGRLVDDLMHRALEGQTDILTRDRDADEVSRFRKDNRLGMSMLARLDNRADGAPAHGGDAALARIIAQDFAAFLDLIESGAGGAGAALFVSARQTLVTPGIAALVAPSDATHGPCELRGAEDEAGDEDEDDEEEESTGVWQDDHGDWLTRFPPPPGFDGDEESEFGDPYYARSLTTEEMTAHLARCEAELAPIRAEAEAARDLYFGFVPKPPEPVKRAAVVKKAKKVRAKPVRNAAAAPAVDFWLPGSAGRAVEVKAQTPAIAAPFADAPFEQPAEKAAEPPVEQPNEPPIEQAIVRKDPLWDPVTRTGIRTVYPTPQPPRDWSRPPPWAQSIY